MCDLASKRYCNRSPQQVVFFLKGFKHFGYWGIILYCILSGERRFSSICSDHTLFLQCILTFSTPLCLHKVPEGLCLGRMLSIVFHSALITLWCLQAAGRSYNGVVFARCCMICAVFCKTHFASNICVLHSTYVICRRALKHNILQSRCFAKDMSAKPL